MARTLRGKELASYRDDSTANATEVAVVEINSASVLATLELMYSELKLIRLGIATLLEEDLALDGE